MRAVGFGLADLSDAKAPGALLDTGRQVCAHMRAGTTLADIASTLFDWSMEPTVHQIVTLMRSAMENLCPGCRFAADATEYKTARPITNEEMFARTWQRSFGDLLNRSFGDLLTDRRSGRTG